MRIGLDIGSTTVKVVALDDTDKVCFSSYARHGSKIAETVQTLCGEMNRQFPDMGETALGISGSAGMGLAEACGLPFVQEVHASRISCSRLAPQADVAIELGGEDAKILFLTGLPDARMNGSCAGGTGAFIDQMATLLKMNPTELNEKAAGANRVYTIASRCGVFAKSDVQPLLNQGARTEDIASSILYSVVNQTIAGLAQGRKIEGNILYLGGPLTFMSELRAAFDHVLGTKGILPENSLYYVAIGTALHSRERFTLSDVMKRFEAARHNNVHQHTQPLFETKGEYDAFVVRHNKASIPVRNAMGYNGRAHLGIDAGSTTVKTVLIDENGEILGTTYLPNSANPVPLVRGHMLDLYTRHPGMTLCSVTVTGYGEALCKEAFRADFGIVETMAHFIAAKQFMPDVDFIIDIGGQDMKCFKITDGTIGDIFLNEACSSGCGSFLQTFAEALGEDVESFSRLGLFADAPVDLGSRCTVFMNSSVKQAQKDGASIQNVSAGLAISVVKNALYKVIRASDPALLGRRIVVQGGTFYNDAVLRAFEKEMGLEVVRPAIAGLMGAYGAALYGRDQMAGQGQSAALSRMELAALTIETKTTNCGLCGNQCTLTINTFSGGRRHISGNRCDRPVTKRQEKNENKLDLYEYKQRLLDSFQPVPGTRGKIGIPMVLNLYETLPFWHTLWTRLGFEVVTSPHSTRKLYFTGQDTIPSDTVCYPAKLAHGHIHWLCKQEDIPTIFYPCMTYNIDEGLSDNHFNCPVVAYYPEVIQANCRELEGRTFLYGHLGIHRSKDFEEKFFAMLKAHYPGITRREVKQAVSAAYASYRSYLDSVRRKGSEIVNTARALGMPIVVLVGRPYHMDGEINHGINKLILSHGAVVISEDSICHWQERGHTNILNQWTYHARLFSAARVVTREADMQLVQLVSFGCGLDAVTTDEVREILHRSGKMYTQIKIDEIANLGAATIRLRSLFAALDQGNARDRVGGGLNLRGAV